jgi:CHASE2 domain-containing sensor protein
VFEAGASAVAIDLLLPERWSRSGPFSQLVLNHSARLVLASYSGADGRVTGPESVRGLATAALGQPAIERLFAFVNVSPDSDGVVRTMPLSYRNERGRQVQSLVARTADLYRPRSDAATATATDNRLWIDYSIDWTAFPRLSWKDVPNVLARDSGAFRDRVILVGGEFAGSGDVYRPGGYGAAAGHEVSGLVLQALAVSTLLAGTDIRASGEPMVAMVLCVAVGIGAAAVLCAARRTRAIGLLVLGCGAYVVCSFLLYRWRHHLSPIGAPVSTFVMACMVSLVVRARLPRHPARLVTPEVPT